MIVYNCSISYLCFATKINIVSQNICLKVFRKIGQKNKQRNKNNELGIDMRGLDPPPPSLGVEQNLKQGGGEVVICEKINEKYIREEEINIVLVIIYICLKQNYIKQYKSLQTNTLFSGYRIL